MAQGKKSFLIYCDIIHCIGHLTNEEKGILFQHLLEYVNDMNPILEDRLLLTAWKPIETQLKRDLKKWEGIKENKSIGGRLGNLKRWNKDLYDKVIKEEITLEYAENIAFNRKTSDTDKKVAEVAVNGNVSVSVNDNVKVIKKNIEERKREFYNSLLPFVDVYGKEMLRDFYEYWSEHGAKDRKFRMEKQKSFSIELRLKTWKKRSKDFKSANEKPQSLADKMKQEYGL